MNFDWAQGQFGLFRPHHQVGGELLPLLKLAGQSHLAPQMSGINTFPHCNLGMIYREVRTLGPHHQVGRSQLKGSVSRVLR